ncbi:MAG: CotH kinase family protein, partial [Bacteroidota bacterium]
HLLPGQNTLSFRFKQEVGDSTRFSHWGMTANVRQWSLAKRNYAFPNHKPWHPSQGFATVLIHVPGNCIPDDPKVKASLRIINAEGDTFRSAIKIETRGHTTLDLMQKSFGFRLNEKDRAVNDTGIPGMGRGSEWVLYAPACDLSMIRNVFSYDLFRDMGHYAVRYEPVEVIINNRYRGIYYLMQRISIGPDRLYLTFDSTAVNDTANSAFLVNVDKPDTNDQVIYQWYSHFIVQKIGRKIPPPPYRSHVGSRLEMMLRIVYKRYAPLDKVIDFDSFADYMILQELSRNFDAYRLSTYFHKDHDSIDPRIHAGPPWDFNLAYGLPGESEQDVFTGWVHEQREKVDSFWTILFNRPDFNKALRSRYAALRKSILTERALSMRIYAAHDRLKPAMFNHQEWIKWPKVVAWPYKEVPLNAEAELQRMEVFLHERLLWMDEQLLSTAKKR